MIPNFRQWAIVFALTLLVGTACAAPPLPCSFWGTVTIDASPAPTGTEIIAKIGLNESGSVIITETGHYGSTDTFGNAFLVSATEDDMRGSGNPVIKFWIGGNKAMQTSEFKSGGIIELDLEFQKTVGPMVPDFNADPTSGVVPQSVHFTDTSFATHTSWLWDFGDGDTSTEHNPVHTYSKEGIFTVSLTVDNNEDYKRVKYDYIKVMPVLYGDANDDNFVNQADTLKVLKWVVGVDKGKPTNGNSLMKTDVTHNNVVDVGDAMFIAQHNVGLRDCYFRIIRIT